MRERPAGSWAAGWKREGEREGLESFFSIFSNPFQTFKTSKLLSNFETKL
jgi:hypothetical protein